VQLTKHRYINEEKEGVILVAGESSLNIQNTRFQNIAPTLFPAFNVAAFSPPNF
jgi:hypothetical protein